MHGVSGIFLGAVCRPQCRIAIELPYSDVNSARALGWPHGPAHAPAVLPDGIHEVVTQGVQPQFQVGAHWLEAVRLSPNRFQFIPELGLKER